MMSPVELTLLTAIFGCRGRLMRQPCDTTRRSLIARDHFDPTKTPRRSAFPAMSLRLSVCGQRSVGHTGVLWAMWVTCCVDKLPCPGRHLGGGWTNGRGGEAAALRHVVVRFTACRCAVFELVWLSGDGARVKWVFDVRRTAVGKNRGFIKRNLSRELSLVKCIVSFL